jgi:hypothetical protein
MRGRWWMALAMVAVLMPAHAIPGRAAPVVLPRPGQIGVGIQGGYGALLKTGDLGNDFSDGPTLAFRLRYRMRYERGLGLSFENQRFGIRVPEAEYPAGSGLVGRKKVNTILSGLEFYQMFGTRTRNTRMIMVGAGLAQTSGRFNKDETGVEDTFYPGDGAYVSLGAGVERFLFRSWALDLSTRYMAVFLPDSRNHDVQVALGFMFYASY